MMKRSFSRVAIVNRGEAALRFLHAALELNREGERIHTIALYTEPEPQRSSSARRTRPTASGRRRSSGRDGRRVAAYLDLGRPRAGAARDAGRGRLAGLGLRGRAAGVRGAVRAAGGDASSAPRRQRCAPSPTRSRRSVSRRASASPSCRGPGPLSADAAEATRQVAGLGLPIVLKPSTGTGGRGVREAETAERLMVALADAARDAGPPAARSRAPARRRPPGRRPGRSRTRGAGSGRCPRATRPSSGATRSGSRSRRRRGLSPVARGRPATGGRPPRARGRLRGGGGDRVPVRPGQRGLLVPRGQRAPRGRARRVGGHDRRRPREDAGARRARRAAARRAAGGDRPRDRGTAVRGGPAGGLRARPGQRRPAAPARRAGAARRRRLRRGRRRAGRVRLDVAKIIAHGRDREEALGRLARALAQTAVILRGGTTNKSFLLDLLDRDEVRDGRSTCASSTASWRAASRRSRRHAELALVRAGDRGVRDRGRRRQGALPLDRAARAGPRSGRRPRAPSSCARPATRTASSCAAPRSTATGSRRTATASRWGSSGSARRCASDASRPPSGVSPAAAPRTACSRSSRDARTSWRSRASPHTFTRDAQGIVTAPAPAIVVSVAVQPGDEVRAGQPLLVVEAMKMETSIDAPFAGRVREVHVVPNVQVGPGDPLVVVDPEPLREDGAARAAAPPRRARPARRGRPPASRQALEELRGLHARLRRRGDRRSRTLSPARSTAARRGVRARRRPACSTSSPTSPRSSAGGRGRRGGVGGGPGFGAEEYLFTYLRKIDERGAGLPDAFLAKLRRALRHYGVVRPPALARARGEPLPHLQGAPARGAAGGAGVAAARALPRGRRRRPSPPSPSCRRSSTG